MKDYPQFLMKTYCLGQKLNVESLIQRSEEQFLHLRSCFLHIIPINFYIEY